MKSLAIILLLVTGSFATAYQDGSFSCKNFDGIPNNTYKIKTVAMPGLDQGVPHVEMTRYFSANSDDRAVNITESKMSGFATQITTSDGIEILQIAAITLEFKNQRLVNCKP